MNLIPVGHGRFATVDADDFERLSGLCWHVGAGGYVMTWLAGRRKEYMHRIVLNTPAGFATDHINRDQLDNRKANLRTCAQQQNTFNQRGSSSNASGFKGVSWKADICKWRARIMVNRREISLGAYATREQAAAAYDSAATQHFGEFAFLNNPEEPKRRAAKVYSIKRK